MNQKLSDPKKQLKSIQNISSHSRSASAKNFLIDAHVLEKIVMRSRYYKG